MHIISLILQFPCIEFLEVLRNLQFVWKSKSGEPFGGQKCSIPAKKPNARRTGSRGEGPAAEEAMGLTWGRRRGGFGAKATLWVKAQHEGALPPPCIVRKDPRVPHTARRPCAPMLGV